MNDPLTVSLPRFEGPLDLLLSLVRKKEVPITGIPIAEITRQYLDYLHQAKELDINLGGEFTFMAATLIWIKTRSLLPRDPAASEPDPQQELINQLLDYEEVRNQAVGFLEDKLWENQNSWSHSLSEKFGESTTISVEEPPPSPETLNVFDVIKLAEKVLEIARAHSRLDLRREEVTLDEMIRWLEQQLAKIRVGGALDSTELFKEQVGVDRKILLFLALLELARLGSVRILQDALFGKVSVVRTMQAASQ